MAQVCRVRGADVEYLLCDGLLPECDQHWDSKSGRPRPFDLCQRCQSAAQGSLAVRAFPHRWLGEFAHPQERASAFEWAQRLRPSEFREASFAEAPLGEWVLSTVISYFRRYPPDLNDQHVVSVYRGFLFSAAVVAMGIRTYLDQHVVDAALVFNGRQSIMRVALELFHQRGIRVLTHERGEYRRGCVNLRPNVHCMNMQPFETFWKAWGHVPLTQEALDGTMQWLVRRRYGADLAWLPFNTPSIGGPPLRTRLNLGPKGRLWALFTSSTDEVSGDPLMQGPYSSQAEWVREVVRWVSSREDVQLVIKVHPNLGGNSYIGKATGELAIYRQMLLTLPPNVRIVLPEDPIDAYSLADEADAGLTFGSTIGLEMAMLGKPVLLASRALYEHGSHVLTVRSKESLPRMLEECLETSANVEIQREAFRLAYYYLTAFEHPFKAIAVRGIYEAAVNYASPDELSPGKDVTLDRICNFLIGGDSFFDWPTPAELSRTSDAEDIFLKKLSSSSGVFKNVRYENWLKLKSFTRSSKGRLQRMPFGAGDLLIRLARGQWRALLARLERNA